MAERDGFPRHVQREIYPKPEQRFAGAKIGLTHEDSRPDCPAPEQAPPRAANAVIVLLDDGGWAVSRAYGRSRTPSCTHGAGARARGRERRETTWRWSS